jgi:ADP-ribosyl-[dinitrogen reductase] hydrolase
MSNNKNNYHYNNSIVNLKPLLIGQMIGDSFLLPYEGLNKRLGKKRFLDSGFKQSLFLNYGMTSDDTDHMLMTAQALLDSYHNVSLFQKKLAWKLQFWFCTLPPGIGMATLKSIVRLWLGFSPTRSGVKSSGNGPLMRTPIIALYYAHDREKRQSFIKASTEITHRNADAIAASQGMGNFIAWLAVHGTLPNKISLKEILSDIAEPDKIWTHYVNITVDNLDKPMNEFIHILYRHSHFSDKAIHIGGVSGYIMHTAPFCLYVLYHMQNKQNNTHTNQNNELYQNAFKLIIEAGGDTDTIGAIVGACLGVLGAVNFEPALFKLFPFIDFKATQERLIYQHFWKKLLLKNLCCIPLVIAHVFVRGLKSLSLIFEK